MPSSRGSSQPRDQTRSPTLQADSLPVEPLGKPKNIAMDSLFILQGIIPTQELNRDLLHCRWILYQLSYHIISDLFVTTYVCSSRNGPTIMLKWGFLGSSSGKESTCNVGDLGLIPGLGRSLEEGVATHSSILAWRIPWTEEPGGLQSMGSRSQT